MGVKEDRSIIEAALYAVDRPLTLDELREILGTSSETYARKLMEELIAEYGKKGGPLVLTETAKGTFSLRLREEYMPKLEKMVPKAKLSRGALKTLAMIAYKQPVKQSEIANIVGTQAYEYVHKLADRKFVSAYASGRTKILKTTKEFAQYFGFETDEASEIKEKMKSVVTVE